MMKGKDNTQFAMDQPLLMEAAAEPVVDGTIQTRRKWVAKNLRDACLGRKFKVDVGHHGEDRTINTPRQYYHYVHAGVFFLQM